MHFKSLHFHSFIYMTSHVTIGQSAVRAQLWLLQRLLGLFVARCAVVCNSLQTGCLQ